MSIDEDYYKPIKANDAFNSSYIECESKGERNKILSIKEYLNMIRPYLRDITNDNKTQGEWKVHSGNAAIDYNTQGEWKIQVSITIKDYNICENHGYCYVEMPKEDNKNIKIRSWRKFHVCSIYYLC